MVDQGRARIAVITMAILSYVPLVVSNRMPVNVFARLRDVAD